jgi:hypothetical protein
MRVVREPVIEVARNFYFREERIGSKRPERLQPSAVLEEPFATVN